MKGYTHALKKYENHSFADLYLNKSFRSKRVLQNLLQSSVSRKNRSQQLKFLSVFILPGTYNQFVDLLQERSGCQTEVTM